MHHSEVYHSLSLRNLSDMSPEEVQQALMEVERDERLDAAPGTGEESSAAVDADASAPLPPADQTDTTVVHLPDPPAVHPLLRWHSQGQTYVYKTWEKYSIF